LNHQKNCFVVRTVVLIMLC